MAIFPGQRHKIGVTGDKVELTGIATYPRKNAILQFLFPQYLTGFRLDSCQISISRRNVKYVSGIQGSKIQKLTVMSIADVHPPNLLEYDRLVDLRHRCRLLKGIGCATTTEAHQRKQAGYKGCVCQLVTSWLHQASPPTPRSASFKPSTPPC